MTQSEEFKKIKPNVWKWTVNDRKYSVKRYQHQVVAQKIRSIHDKLGKIQFSQVLPITPSDDAEVIVQPWLDNVRAADYKKKQDRTRSLQLLHQIHDTREQIDWTASELALPHYHLMVKWQDRLQKFKHSRQQIAVYIGDAAVQQLILYAEEALEKMKKTPMPSYGQKTLLHGDVVHHNFLVDEQGAMTLIDFDLAAVGSAYDELVMWMHRVLPQVGYDLPKLLAEQPLLGTIPKEYFLALRYPNEVLREWLYVGTVATTRQSNFIRELISYTQVALSSWPKLWYDSGSIK